MTPHTAPAGPSLQERKAEARAAMTALLDLMAPIARQEHPESSEAFPDHCWVRKPLHRKVLAILWIDRHGRGFRGFIDTVDGHDHAAEARKIVLRGQMTPLAPEIVTAIWPDFVEQLLLAGFRWWR